LKRCAALPSQVLVPGVWLARGAKTSVPQLIAPLAYI